MLATLNVKDFAYKNKDGDAIKFLYTDCGAFVPMLSDRFRTFMVPLLCQELCTRCVHDLLLTPKCKVFLGIHFYQVHI